MVETGIDYELKAYEATEKGDFVAAQAWATLHQARMTRELTAVVDDIRDAVEKIRDRVGAIANAP